MICNEPKALLDQVFQLVIDLMDEYSDKDEAFRMVIYKLERPAVERWEDVLPY